MRKTAILLGLLTLGIAMPQSASAGRDWDDNKYVWGGAGLVIGSTLGVIAARHHHYGHHRPYHYRPYRPYYCPPSYGYRTYSSNYDLDYYDPGPGYVGGEYRMVKFSPFYKKVEYSPTIRVAPVSYSPQSISMADRYTEPETKTAETQPQPVSITIGDNNSDVRISVGVSDREDLLQTATVTQPNYNSARSVGQDPLSYRVVDRQVQIEKSVKPASANPATDTKSQPVEPETEEEIEE